MSQLSLDIIIPIYNPGRFLERCLQSVLNQTYKGKFRLILVDDGSTEPVEEIIEATIGKKSGKKSIEWVYIKLPENSGAAYARNIGIKHAKADLIFFLDADDEMLPKRLALSVAIFKKCPELIMVCGNFRWVIDGKVSSACFITPPEIYYATMLIHFPINASTVAIRREIFNEVGFFNEEYVVGEDYDLWMRIAQRFPQHIHYIHEEIALYNWCAVEGSLTGRYRGSAESEAIFEEIRKKYGAL